MNRLVLNDAFIYEDLYPLGQLRSVADIRIGICTIREKWESFFGFETVLTRKGGEGEPEVAANWIPDERLAEAVRAGRQMNFVSSPEFKNAHLQFPWQIFEWNGWWIEHDFEIMTRGRTSEPLSGSNHVIQGERIFLESGARVEHCFLNASTGPIYIGRNAEIMEGAMIRGPFALCEGGLVKMGTTIYGATTVGPYSTVAGEIKNSVITGYSNKAHHGYLGDSVIGEWCNLGAGTSNSNLKNNASTVKVWSKRSRSFIPAGLKCGLFMGDYSRCAINTSFQTGSLVGICCNVFGDTTPAKYVPDFSWGQGGMRRYSMDKAMRDISTWKNFKGKQLTEDERSSLENIFANT